MKVAQASGKRKEAVARSVAREGTGKVRVNNVLLSQVTPALSQQKMNEPILLAGDAAAKVDIDVSVRGGGSSSQADAVRLAIANVLALYSKNKKLKELFVQYDRNIVVADVRRKEVKKPNRHGKARAKRQKSYR